MQDINNHKNPTHFLQASNFSFQFRLTFSPVIATKGVTILSPKEQANLDLYTIHSFLSDTAQTLDVDLNLPFNQFIAKIKCEINK